MTEKLTLIKYIAAHAGFSRRKAEEIIKERRVSVNGRLTSRPWSVVNEEDQIKLDGKVIEPTQKVYIMLNKPEGVITSMADNEGRTSVAKLIKGASRERLFPVGRLDVDTTGLLLFTNDGTLAQKLSHPRFSVSKEYQVTLTKPVTEEHLKQLLKGIYLTDGKAWFDRAVFAQKTRKFVIIVTLHSGKKRIIRRLFGKLGYEVRKLDRIAYAGLSKRSLSPGKWRKLTQPEIDRLQKLVI